MPLPASALKVAVFLGITACYPRTSLKHLTHSLPAPMGERKQGGGAVYKTLKDLAFDIANEERGGYLGQTS